MKKLLKWQVKFLAELGKISNEELLEWVLNLAGGDDYDGCFTPQGEWKYSELLVELEKRLKICRFLGE